MSEPTVEIPARVALVAGKHLYHLAKVIEGHDSKFNKLSDSFFDAVKEQCSPSEIDVALVAAEIMEAE